MANALGDTGRLSFTLASSGQAFFRTASLINGVATVWNPTFSDLGDGAYEATAILTTVGSWQWIGTASDGTPVVVEWDVISTPSITSATILTSLAAVTLQEMRRNIQDTLDDLIVIAATQNGDTNIFYDTANLFDSGDAWVASQLYFISGTPDNVGHLAKVTGGDESFGLISYTPATPFATAEGDSADLHNLHGSGWTRAMVVRRINQKIQETFPHVLIGRVDQFVAVFDCHAPVLAVPPSMTHVSQPQWLGRSGVWEEVPPSRWIANIAAQTVEICGAERRWAHGQAIRFVGYGKHPQVAAETDLILIDPEWLRLVVSSDLASQRTGDRSRQQQWIEWARRADERYGNMMTSRLPNTVRFR